MYFHRIIVAMRKKLLILFCSIVSLTGFAQELKLEADSLSEVLKRAKLENKLVFTVLTSPKNTIGYSETMRVVKYLPGLAYYNQNFLNYAITYDEKDGAALRDKFEAKTFPAFLYLDGNGNIVYRTAGMSPYNQNRFLDDANIALLKFNGGRTISWYQSEIAAGKATPAILREYIIESQSLGISVNNLIIDEYVKQQRPGNFNKLSEVLFVLEAGPVFQSFAYNRVQLNRKVFDSIYTVLPYQRRVAINNRIIRNTIKAAIEQKDVKLAARGASFARSTWPEQDKNGIKAYESNMLNYYRSVKDTANYLKNLVKFTNNFYLDISADSIKRISAARATIAEADAKIMIAGPAGDTSKVGLANLAYQNMPREVVMKLRELQNRDTTGMGRPVMSSSLVSVPPPNPVAGTLNDNAWGIYLTRTTNKTYLDPALVWAKRAVQLDPRSAHYDTLAHILYRLNSLEEAIATQQKAIKVAQQNGEDTTAKTAELQKMILLEL